MQSAGIFDTVTVERGGEISVGCSVPELSGENNLAARAAGLFFESTGVKSGARISIEKHIPVAAGLAGGSADAAAVLLGLDALYGTALGPGRLCELGLSAGADVPFCLSGGTLVARGTGEKLTAAPGLCDCAFVIVKEGEKPSTGDLYARWDSSGEKTPPHTSEMLGALASRNLAAVSSRLFNAFSKLVQQNGIADRLCGLGALGASLSGSGPSVFAVFPDGGAALECARALGPVARVCAPARQGCEIVETA